MRDIIYMESMDRFCYLHGEWDVGYGIVYVFSTRLFVFVRCSSEGLGLQGVMVRIWTATICLIDDIHQVMAAAESGCCC
jgi:hypothetical protein